MSQLWVVIFIYLSKEVNEKLFKEVNKKLCSHYVQLFPCDSIVSLSNCALSLSSLYYFDIKSSLEISCRDNKPKTDNISSESSKSISK